MDCSERIYNDIAVAISDKLDDNSISVVLRCVSDAISKYNIEEKCTDLVVYDPFPECAKYYLASRKIEGLSINSLNLYKLRIEQFFNIVRKPIDKVTANDVRIFLYKMQESLSLRSLDGVRTCISTFFKWCLSEGYITQNPVETIRPIKYVPNPRGYLSALELERLRDACDNVRDKALIEFLYSTGCRVSELIGVKISDIDFGKKTVVLFGKGSKYRTAYLNAKAELSLSHYIKSRSDDNPWLFVSLRKPHDKLKKEAVEKIIRELGIKAKIDRRVFPHLIRHTTATIGLQRGMDITEVQRLLGHSKIETTMVYASVADESVKESHKRFIV